MASKKAIATVIMTIKTVYSYYAKDNDIEILAKIWEKTLTPYDDNSVNKALLLSLRESKMPPTPADIIEQIENLSPQKNEFELWAEFMGALKKICFLQQHFYFTAIDESIGKTEGQIAREKAIETYNKLSPELKKYIGSYGEMERMARRFEYEDEFLDFEKTRFIKSAPNLIKKKQKNLFLENMEKRGLIDGE